MALTSSTLCAEQRNFPFFMALEFSLVSKFAPQQTLSDNTINILAKTKPARLG